MKSQKGRTANILAIHTGGTLAMVASDDGYCPKPGALAHNLKKAAWTESLPGKRFRVTFATDRVLEFDLMEYTPVLDSANIGHHDWVRIGEDLVQHMDAYDGFVVIHGTDTMAYTASALSFALRGLPKPVVFTGSQIPLFEVRNDARENLLGALYFAAFSNVNEVLLYFRETLFRGNRTSKVDASSLSAFASPNYPPLGTAGVRFEVRPELALAKSAQAKSAQTKSKQTFSPKLGFSSDVASVRLFPGISARAILNAAQPPIRGLVMEVFGAGNIPDKRPEIIDAIAQITRAGVVVVIVTQCHRGRVAGDYAAGRLLYEVGVVSGADLTAEAALTKLAHLLATETNPTKIRKLMQAPLVGEMAALLNRR